MRPLRLCALLAILLSPVFALSRKYDRGPVPLSPKASLHWTLDNAASRISLALVIKDSAVLSGAGKNATWLGLGISEASAGSMIGADIASAEFVSGSLTKCALADRHVPFAAYPLGQTTGNATGVFPEKDTCQDDGSWVLVSCARDPKAGTAALELSRTLAAHDGQDREIGLGIQALIFAYGVKGFKYHGNLRGSAKLTLFNKDGTYPPLKERPLPPKITFRHLVPATNYTVPSENATTYACTTSIVPLPASRKRMLVAVDPVITDKSGKNVVHHLVVYACPPTNYSRRYFKTAWCTDDSPLGSEAGCTAMLFVWAVGIGRFVLPDGVGLQVDATNNHIVMETHYDNPGAAKGIVDTSGVRLYFEDERPIRAGTIALGDPVLSLGGLTVKHDFEYVSSCSSNCTRTWKEPIKVFSSFQHMHTTGRKIFTNHFAANGSFIQPFGSIEYWSNDHQFYQPFSPPRVLRPGDKLSTTCIYDTRKRPATQFGLATKNEMCVDFLYYYPLQERVAGAGSMSYCAGFNMRRAPAGGPTITMCGPLNDDASFTRELNPTFNDTVGTPDKFGFKPKQCPAPLAPSMEAEPSTPAVEAAAPSPEKEPSPPALSPSPSAAPDAVCFPARSLVQTPRGLVRMRDLRLGDSVLVAVGKFSPVFMFTHKIDDGLFPFVELRTARGAIALSTGHLLYVDGTLRAADTVKPGDLLRLPAGGDEPVLSVRAVQETGLYNPQTLHGDIVVDGVVASTYTSAVRPEAAHALLAPIRAAAGLECRVSILEKDESGFVRALRKLAWMLSGGLPAVASV